VRYKTLSVPRPTTRAYLLQVPIETVNKTSQQTRYGALTATVQARSLAQPPSLMDVVPALMMPIDVDDDLRVPPLGAPSPATVRSRSAVPAFAMGILGILGDVAWYVVAPSYFQALNWGARFLGIRLYGWPTTPEICALGV